MIMQRHTNQDESFLNYLELKYPKNSSQFLYIRSLFFSDYFQFVANTLLYEIGLSNATRQLELANNIMYYKVELSKITIKMQSIYEAIAFYDNFLQGFEKDSQKLQTFKYYFGVKDFDCGKDIIKNTVLGINHQLITDETKH